ncbi:MAG: hypothetical protein SchgKO_11910 [Schleiferiaceae bacterium]
MDNNQFLFGKKNYTFLIGGLILIGLGLILMMGGGSDDPNVFNPEIFSPQRIVVAPTLILLGLVVEIYAIMVKDKSEKSTEE